MLGGDVTLGCCPSETTVGELLHAIRFQELRCFRLYLYLCTKQCHGLFSGP